MQFGEHGRYKVFVEENVVIAIVTGAFNLEAVEGYITRIDNVIGSLNGAPYFVVLDLRLLEGATPEAWDLVEIHNRDMALDDNLRAKAIISSLSLVHDLGEKVNKPISDYKVSSFRQLPDAMAWLIKHGMHNHTELIQQKLT